MKYTLVTGAISDIGREICQTLDRSGHTLLLTDWDETALKETMTVLDSTKPHKYVVLDLSNSTAAIDTLKSYIQDNALSIENAVFAAGIFKVKPIKLLDYDYIKNNFDIALFSTLMITQVISSKKINGENLKAIVFLSSVSAKMGTKGYTVYSAVKAAMLGAMKSIAAELAPKVRVNAILPGGVRTRTTAFLYDAMELNPRYLLGEGNINDIANMVEYLLSDMAKWITGQEFIVDGGLTCN